MRYDLLLYDTFGPPMAPAALPFAPGAAIYIVFFAAALVIGIVWRRQLPEWGFPVKGRWLRYLLTGAVSVGVLLTYLLQCSVTRTAEIPLLW